MNKAEAKQAERFSRLFAGLERVYGRYRVTSVQPNGKHVGDQPGAVSTCRGKLTIKEWEGHLAGRQGIGVNPIRDDATCVFGAIDVDDYTLETAGLARIVARVAEKNLPIVPCRTKSGGVHLYLFAAAPTRAELMRARLREIESVLGFGGSEIFPKQDKLVTEQDCGCWINMPYFDGTEGGRYALRLDGSPIPESEFLDVAEGLRQPVEFFELPVLAPKDLFADGPPCLQKLLAEGGFSEGNRNTLLFNAAVYAVTSTPPNERWEEKLHAINEAACRPPLSRAEVDDVVKSIGRRRTYRYKCRQEPIHSCCDSKLCRVRPFGVGRDGRQGDGGGRGDGDQEAVNESFPRLAQLRVLNTDPPTWFWDTTAGRTIQLTTEELQSPRLFQKRCMEILKLMPTMPTQPAWTALVNQALATALEIDPPEDSNDEGQVWELLEQFCTGKVQARNKREILLGKPWSEPGASVTWFRLRDFRQYLDQQHFRGEMTKVHLLCAMFHKRGLEKKFEVLDKKGNKGAQLWGVPTFAPQPEMDVPASVKDEERPF